jgi:hypothetical protein
MTVNGSFSYQQKVAHIKLLGYTICLLYSSFVLLKHNKNKVYRLLVSFIRRNYIGMRFGKGCKSCSYEMATDTTVIK